MKIAVLSDIHGNYEALKEILSYCEKKNVDEYIFLGDYVGELPKPKKTLDLIYELMERKTCYMIRGNREDYFINGLGEENPEWDPYKSVVGTMRYVQRNISYDDIALFKTFPITMRLEYEGLPALRLCHGSPKKSNDCLYKMDKEYISSIEEDFILCGHTHKVTDLFISGKRIINPGSVGMPLDGKKMARIVFLTSNDSSWDVKFIALPYDVESEIAHMYKEGLPYLAPVWTMITEHLLSGGTVTHGTVLKSAMEKYEEEKGHCEWPKIPEEYMWDAFYRLVPSKLSEAQ